MIVFDYGERKTSRIAACGRVETEAAFHDIPAIVNSTSATGWLEIYFFPVSLPNVRDIKIARCTVKGGTPRIAEADVPNLRPGVSSSKIGIRRWNRVASRIAGLHVDSQDLSRQHAQILARTRWVTCGPGADAEIKIAIERTKGELASEMVRGKIITENDFFGIRIRDIAIRRNVITGDDQNATATCRTSCREGDIVDIEMLFVRIIGRKSDTQEPSVPAHSAQPGGDIQKWSSEQCTIFDDADTAWLFDDKQSSAAVGR